MTHTNYFISGTTVSLQRSDAFTVTDTLPAAVYYVRMNPVTKELFLSRTDEFNPPSKLYGDTAKNADRIVRTFMDRQKSTGVLLEGVKGAGKTLLTKVVSAKLISLGIPTVIVDTAFSGPAFTEFVGKIGVALMLFDEFEKTFRSTSDDSTETVEQEALLTLFDGTIESKKLFMLSVNNTYLVSDFFINRPGRIFYSFKFSGLSEAAIREYCKENLKNKEQIESVVRISKVFSDFTFDSLSALIEEMNRYDEAASVAIRNMNITPARGQNMYDVEVVCEASPGTKFHPTTTMREPTIGEEDLYIHDDKHDASFYVRKKHLVSMNQDGSFEYLVEYDGKTYSIKTTRSKETQTFNFDAF